MLRICKPELLLASCVLVANVQAAPSEQNCELGSQYELLAQRAEADLDVNAQLLLLEKSVDACESFSGYISLGEAAAGYANNKKSMRAAEAFSRAYELADGPQEEARALYNYAKLLHHTNNNQQALRYAYAAKNLSPGNPKISALAERVATNARTITEDQIVRGFGRLALKPLQLKEDVTGATSNNGGAGTRISKPSVNIPLNFEFGSTRLTAQSKANIAILASTLGRHYSTSNIVFVGHADSRGDADFNLALSISRAQEIQREVVALSPSLGTQISIAGKGESALLSTGETETDHSVNRRLEIIIQR